jgi:hypothetical protein
VQLATSLVASLQLIAAAVVYAYATNVADGPMSAAMTASVVSLSGGALVANIVSVVILVIETVSFRRR